MATVKGRWIFQETLNMGGDIEKYGMAEPPTGLAADFTSGGAQYKSFAFDVGDLYYEDWVYDYFAADNSPQNLVYYGHWPDPVYRTVDFGPTEQTVSDELYAWLISNAEAAEEPDAVYAIHNRTLADIADAIREKVGTDNKYSPLEMPEAIHAVYEAGKAAGMGGS